MSTYRGKPAATINQNMKSLLPETDGCGYADFPMNLGSKWLTGKDKTPPGEPCFIKTENKLPEEGAKTGYVWGPGPFGFGYYHLMTRNAHVLLYNRVNNNKVDVGPSEGFCCFGETDPRSVMPSMSSSNKDDLRLLFHARSVATAPNDGQAMKDQIGEATNMAMGHQFTAGGGPDLVEIARLGSQQKEIQKMNR